MGSLREGRGRGARGADRQLRGLGARRARHEPPRLPEGGVLHRGDVRPEPPHGPHETGGRARLRQVAANQLGAGHRRDLGADGRHRREARHGHHLPGPRAQLRPRRNHRGPLQVPDEGGRDVRRHVGRDRRPQHRRHPDPRHGAPRRLERRVVPLRFRRRVDDESLGDADGRRALPLRSAAQRDRAHGDRSAVQRDGDPRGQLAADRDGQRCRPGAGGRTPHLGQRQPRRRLRARADGLSAPGAPRHRPLLARRRPASRRERGRQGEHPLLVESRRGAPRAGSRIGGGRQRQADRRGLHAAHRGGLRGHACGTAPRWASPRWGAS